MDEFIPDELIETAKQIENTNEVLKAAIQDLTIASNEMEEALSYLKNPLKFIFTDDIGAKVEECRIKMQLHLLMFANKMEALPGIMGAKKEGEE